jgi:hypothetical protein
MKRDDALRLVAEMEEFLAATPGARSNKDAEGFFRDRCYELKIAVSHNKDCANVVNWAGIYYSANKWERYGEAKVKEFLEKALGRVKARTENYYNWIAD